MKHGFVFVKGGSVVWGSCKASELSAQIRSLKKDLEVVPR